MKGETMKIVGAPLYIFEGTWWSNREVPLVLPYFQALETSHGGIQLSHRTIRSADDIAYWIGKIPKDARAFVYFACHGSNFALYPTKSHPIYREDLLKALAKAKKNAVWFLHFGCCEMVNRENRGISLNKLAVKRKDIRWVSGYVNEIDWLDSTLLDLALVAKLYVPYYRDAKYHRAKLKNRIDRFLKEYDQLARQLGFSTLICNLAGYTTLFPKRLHA
jgi:hypothetical protein